MKDDHTQSELEMFSIIEKDQVVSQSGLSKRLGIAAGLVNFLIKRAVSKGFVIAKRVPARRYAYFLTPKGMAEKTRLVADYMNTSLQMFRILRVEFEEICEIYVNKPVELVLVGDMELAEVLMLAGLAQGVTVRAIVCEKTNRSHLGDIPIFQDVAAAAMNSSDCQQIYVVGDIYNAQECYDDLVVQFGAEAVVVPDALCVTCAEDQHEAASTVARKPV